MMQNATSTTHRGAFESIWSTLHVFFSISSFLFTNVSNLHGNFPQKSTIWPQFGHFGQCKTPEMPDFEQKWRNLL